MEKTKLAMEKCERDFDLNRAAELQYSILPAQQKELDDLLALEDAAKENNNNNTNNNNSTPLLRDEVVAADIADVVCVADRLRQRVVGQDEAVTVVTQAIQRSRAGL